MIVAILHVLIAGVAQHHSLIAPAVGLQRRGGGHIWHAACSGCVDIGVWPRRTTLPRRAVAVDPATADVVQFARLEEVGSGDWDYLAVNAEHVGREAADACSGGIEVCAIAGHTATKGEPRHTVVVNHHTGIEGIGTVAYRLRTIVDEVIATEWAVPWAKWRGRGEQAHTRTTRRIEHVKVCLAVSLLATDNRGGP